MIKSDSLDHITLDSANIQSIERFENNYYNHKNNLLQNGGNIQKLEKNIVRLYNCYVLSQNQKQDELSSKIKRRLDKKMETINNVYIGGDTMDKIKLFFATTGQIKDGIIKSIDNNKNKIIDSIITALKKVIDNINEDKIIFLKIIFKPPNNNEDYRNWLHEQIKNWINNENNKNNIFDQIKSHIENFKNAPSTLIAPEIETEIVSTQETPTDDFIDGLNSFFDGIKVIFATPKMIKDGIIKSIDNNKQKIIDSIITALKIVLNNMDKDKINFLKKILKDPNNNKDYNNWLHGQIKNWINNENNKDVIFNQIKSHINNFIDASLQETQEVPSGNLFDGIHHFIKLQAPPIKA